MTSFPALQQYAKTGAGGVTGPTSFSNTIYDASTHRFFTVSFGRNPNDGIIAFDLDSGEQLYQATAAAIYGSGSDVTTIACITYGGLICMANGASYHSSQKFSLIDQNDFSLVEELNFINPDANWPASLGGVNATYMVPASVSTNNYVALGLGAFSTNYVVLQADIGNFRFAGHVFKVDETRAYPASTIAGAGVFYLLGGTHDGGSIASFGLYKTTIASSASGYDSALWPGTPNPHITTTKIATIAASTIDATWTTLSSVNWVGYDQADGNMIITIGTSNSVSTKNYMVKLAVADGSIMWSLATAFGSSGGNINGTLWVSSGNSIYEIDTSAGTLTTTLGPYNPQWLAIGSSYFDYPSRSVYVPGNYTEAVTPPFPAAGIIPGPGEYWSRLTLSAPPAPAVSSYYIERLTPLFDDNIPDNQHCFLDSCIVPPSAKIATLATDGFDGIRCYGMDILTSSVASSLAGVLGGMDIGDSTAALNGVVDFAFNDTFTLAYVQSFGTTTFPQVFLDQYQVAIDSNGTDGTNELYYVIPFIVGFAYTSQGQLLRPNHGADAGARTGPAMGRIRRNHWYAALLYRTQGDLTFSTDFTNLHPAELVPYGDSVATAQPDLFSGTITTTIDDDYSLDGMITFQMTRPLPCTLVSISGYIETQDK